MPYTVQFAQKALILRGEEVLLIQKGAGDTHNPYRWEVPGGRMERDETVDEHLRREVLEEVGLRVQVGAPLSVWSWSLGSAVGSTVVAVLRLCSLETDSLSTSNQDPGDHIRDARWVPVDELVSYDLMPSARDAILRAVRVAMDLRRSGWGQ